jgi:hypothetical protein
VNDGITCLPPIDSGATVSAVGMVQPIATNPDAQQFDALYELHFPALMELAVERFSLPDHEARQVAHDALIASIHSGPRIVDMRSWLVGAVISGITRSRGSHS